MIKTAFAATLAILFTFCAPANAQFSYTPKSKEEVGLYLGTQLWQSEATGVLGEENMLIDFNLKKEQQINYFIDVKHLRISGSSGHSFRCEPASHFGIIRPPISV